MPGTDRGKSQLLEDAFEIAVLREHRETLALEKWVSRAPSDLPFIIYLTMINSFTNKKFCYCFLGAGDVMKFPFFSFFLLSSEHRAPAKVKTPISG